MYPPDSKAHSIVETFNRLQVCASMDGWKGQHHWLDILGMTKSSYRSFLSGKSVLPESAVISLGKYLGISAEDILNDTVDYRAISIKRGGGLK